MQLCNETKFAVAMDLHGRMIVPDAELTAIELLAAPSSEEVETLSKQLQRQLLDYRSPMAAPQRRFLQHQLSEALPGRVDLPMLAAEELAARFIEAGPVRLPALGLHQVPPGDLWEFSPPSGRSLLLFETEHLRAKMLGVIVAEQIPADVNVRVLPPGFSAPSFLSDTAGP